MRRNGEMGGSLLSCNDGEPVVVNLKLLAAVFTVAVVCIVRASPAYGTRLPYALGPDDMEAAMMPLGLSQDQLAAIRPELFALMERVKEHAASAAEELRPIQARARDMGREGIWTDAERESFAGGFQIRERAVREVVRIYRTWMEEELSPVLSPGQLRSIDFVRRRFERIVHWQAAYLARHQSRLDPVWFMLDSLRASDLDDPAAMGAVLALLRQADVQVTRSLRSLFHEEEKDRRRVFTSINIQRFNELTEDEFALWRRHARLRLAREKQFARLCRQIVDRATSFLDEPMRARIRFDWFRLSHPVAAEPLRDTAGRDELRKLQELIAAADADLAPLASDAIATWFETDRVLLQRLAQRHMRFRDEMSGSDPRSEEDFRERFRDVWSIRSERAGEYRDLLLRLDELVRGSSPPRASDAHEAVMQVIAEHLDRSRRRIAELEVAGDMEMYDPGGWPNQVR